jgi:hypothetical protein
LPGTLPDLLADPAAAEAPLEAASSRLIREHLEVLLTDPLFQHSKRLPGFLRYVVHEALENGSHFQIKERTLGIVVFGRSPDYDTNADPVVRMTAGEVRKKLAQYYYAHPNAEVQIEVPLGSYMPRFRFAKVPVSPTVSPLGLPEVPPATPLPVATPPEPPIAISAAAAEPSQRPRGLGIGVVVLTLALVAIGLAVWRAVARETPVDRFWDTFGSTSRQVLIVLPALARVPQPLPLYHFEAESVAIEDARVAARLSSDFKVRNLNSRLALASAVSLNDLRTGPFVLIGAMDNVWTMRLSQSLPYAFERSEDRRYGRIIDRKDPGNIWTEDFSVPNADIPVDYGIIARFTDPTTEQPTLLIAGISAEGTLAAGEAVTTPHDLDMLLKAAGHASGNFEAVIETRVIEGQSGPPRIVAIRTW